jgi:hypothetical protein
MKIHRLLFALGSLLGLAGGAAQGNVVADWHATLESTVVVTGKKSPSVAFVYFAYADIAMFDAVNSIDRRFTPFAVQVAASPGASREAAASVAAHDVLAYYLPAQLATIDAALNTSLGAIPEGPAKQQGMEVGHQVATQWLAMRSGDGLEAAVTLTMPALEPGVWRPVPTYPSPTPVVPPPVAEWQAQFEPFALKSADQFLARVPEPVSLTGPIFTHDFNQTKAYGAVQSTVRSAEQTEIGVFWADNPAAQYSRALRGLIDTQALGTSEAARLAALSYVALADSATACMNAKYHFWRWRPVAAIREGVAANPLVVADPNWMPLDVTPGHPEYPANHGCVTEALMDVMTSFFGTDEIPYSVSSTSTGTTHAFDSFEDVVKEVGHARIYGGMHFHHSVREGNKLGHHVAVYILNHKFCPVNEGCSGDDD